ncbi:MAG: sulfatase [Bacteroidaceae bacterium]|nr:sulfatase [Bacteroidaceae bacterium]
MARIKRTVLSAFPFAPVFITALPLSANPSSPFPLVGGQGEGVDGDARPNILYIMADDHTAQMMSCYDSRFVETPNLDRIARDGVRFSQSFVANSLSGPSRACMITGKHSHKNGFTNNEHGIFDGSQQTMPKLLQSAGYTTAIIGKWHLVSTPTGFDHWEILPGQGDYYNPTFIHQDGTRAVDSGYVTRILTDKAISWIDSYIHQPSAHHAKPFALFLHHKACHRCWLPDIDDLTLYEDKTFPLPENFWDDYESRDASDLQEMEIGRHMDIVYDTKMWAGKDTPRTRLSRSYRAMVQRLSDRDLARYDSFYIPLSREFYSSPLSKVEIPWQKPGRKDAKMSAFTPLQRSLAEFKYQRYMRDYAKVVHELDNQVGRLLDYLQQQGLMENTLVVYTSDQGFYMGEHGWFDKRFMYEESLATPLVMLLPKGYERRGVIKDMVQNIDYAPTFLEMAGIPIPPDIQGESLVPLLRGRAETKEEKERRKNWRDAIYYHYYEYPAEHAVRRHYGIRTDRYKLIHFYGHDIDKWELYDLKHDPREKHNLYGKPGYEKLQRHMHHRLELLQIKYDDPQR